MKRDLKKRRATIETEINVSALTAENWKEAPPLSSWCPQKGEVLCHIKKKGAERGGERRPAAVSAKISEQNLDEKKKVEKTRRLACRHRQQRTKRRWPWEVRESAAIIEGGGERKTSSNRAEKKSSPGNVKGDGLSLNMQGDLGVKTRKGDMELC